MNASDPERAPVDRPAWRPAQAIELELGPAIWDGSRITYDTTREGQARVVSIGLRERMILEELDGERDVHDVHQALQEHGMPITESSLLGTLNQMIVLGLVVRPFQITSRGVTSADSTVDRVPTGLPEIIAATRETHFEPWRLLRWLGSGAGVSVVAVAAAISSAIVATASPTAWASLTGSDVGWSLLLLVLLASCWNMLVTLVHECAHAAAFSWISSRRPQIAVVRLGILPLANTQLPGLNLLSKRKQAHVVLVGPLVSIALAAIPAAGVLAAPPATFLHNVSVACLLIDVAVIGLSISFFPNTDGTRLVEVLGSVNQIQRVAVGTLLRQLELPTALPLSTRIAVRAYPILLLGSLVAALGASALAIRLAMT